MNGGFGFGFKSSLGGYLLGFLGRVVCCVWIGLYIGCESDPSFASRFQVEREGEESEVAWSSRSDGPWEESHHPATHHPHLLLLVITSYEHL